MDWTDGPKQAAVGLMLFEAVDIMQDVSKCGGSTVRSFLNAFRNQQLPVFQ